jgi:hypothetical protein
LARPTSVIAAVHAVVWVDIRVDDLLDAARERVEPCGTKRAVPTVAAEHFTFCSNNAHQDPGLVRRYAGQLVPERIIESSSKLDSLRVLEEAGVVPTPSRTLKRLLPNCSQEANTLWCVASIYSRESASALAVKTS